MLTQIIIQKVSILFHKYDKVNSYRFYLYLKERQHANQILYSNRKTHQIFNYKQYKQHDHQEQLSATFTKDKIVTLKNNLQLQFQLSQKIVEYTMIICSQLAFIYSKDYSMKKQKKALNNKKEIKFEILIVQKIFSYLHLPVNGIFVYKDGFCYLNPIFILDIHQHDLRSSQIRISLFQAM
ncbi:unnamed protein product [Paramecium primaurelia]|uniref:Uncharacterized protein n=1 Tax=Paramecium primaurelia TaxID=5886 RepID=A0A8S1LGQ9_PARPR|nr:unnamed protein product [Paramecium primaurelia]